MILKSFLIYKKIMAQPPGFIPSNGRIRKFYNSTLCDLVLSDTLAIVKPILLTSFQYYIMFNLFHLILSLWHAFMTDLLNPLSYY